MPFECVTLHVCVCVCVCCPSAQKKNMVFELINFFLNIKLPKILTLMRFFRIVLDIHFLPPVKQISQVFSVQEKHLITCFLC